MHDCALISLAFAWPALPALYWICLIVGGGLLLISSLAGTDADAGIDADIGPDVAFDADVDADFSADVDTGADVDMSADSPGHAHAEHAHAGSLASWFSIQFLVFFMASFGLVGVVLTGLTDTGQYTVLGFALLAGIVIGQGVHQLMRSLRRSSGDSTLQPKDYINRPGRVTVSIRPPDKGEVALQVGRGERYLPAIAKRADCTFGIGDEVAVVGYSGGIAEVISREEFDFLTDGNQGGAM